MLYVSPRHANTLPSLLSRIYNWLMSKFIAANGQEVDKFVTNSGVTGYVATSIPMEAIEGLKRKLVAKIARLDAEAAKDATKKVRPCR